MSKLLVSSEGQIDIHESIFMIKVECIPGTVKGIKQQNKETKEINKSGIITKELLPLTILRFVILINLNNEEKSFLGVL